MIECPDYIDPVAWEIALAYSDRIGGMGKPIDEDMLIEACDFAKQVRKLRELTELRR